MKVYVITQGSYSDYHICGVSLDKEKAEKIRRLYSDDWDDAQVEEYDTEANDAPLREGHPFKVWRNECGLITVTEPVYETMDTFYEAKNKVIEDDDGGHYVRVFALDKKHAQKIGIDLILKYMAEKEGL